MEIEKQKKEISAEELQLYDRQRFIGIEVQKRLLNAVVLITPMNGVNTELSKNLILSGTNISIADNEQVTQTDVETNFLIAPSDLGKIRGEVIGQKLREMNPNVTIEIYKTFDITKYYNAYIKKDGSEYSEFQENFLKNFDIVSTSVKQFSQMSLFEEITKQINVPYYNLLCCGFSGFYYVNLGSNFDFVKKKAKQQVFKNGKKKDEQDEYEEFEKVEIQGSTVQNTLDKSKNLKPIYKAIQVMAEAEKQGLSYCPFNPNQKTFDKIFKYAQDNFKMKEDQVKSIQNFIKFYGIEYCPTYSVIGSVASQEYIKVIGRDAEPGINWFIYDSQDGYGRVENIQGDKSYKKTDLPELRRKIDPSEI